MASQICKTTKMDLLDKLCELNDYLFTFQATPLAQNLVTEVITLADPAYNEFSQLLDLFNQFLKAQDEKIDKLKAKLDSGTEILCEEEKEDIGIDIDYYETFRHTTIKSIELVTEFISQLESS